MSRRKSDKIVIADKAGRAYAKMSETRPGDILETDGGFTCMREGSHLMCRLDERGELYIECDDGQHFLSGQADDGEHMIGLYRSREQKAA